MERNTGGKKVERQTEVRQTIWREIGPGGGGKGGIVKLVEGSRWKRNKVVRETVWRERDKEPETGGKGEVVKLVETNKWREAALRQKGPGGGRKGRKLVERNRWRVEQCGERNRGKRIGIGRDRGRVGVRMRHINLTSKGVCKRSVGVYVAAPVNLTPPHLTGH